MIQATINIDNSDMSFLNKSRSNGFKDKINLIKTALTYLKQKFGKTNLKASANLYAENYNEDKEVKEITESALEGWPDKNAD